MIKIRLEGLPQLVQAFAWLIKGMPAIRVIDESHDYQNERRNTHFVRRYLTVELRESPDGDEEGTQ